jgi:hypothetical protein
MTHARTHGWELRLAGYVDRVKDKPYRYGKHDCTTFAVGCLRAMTERQVPNLNYHSMPK